MLRPRETSCCEKTGVRYVCSAVKLEMIWTIENDEPASDTEIDTVGGAEIDGMDSTLDPASETAAPVNTSGVDKRYDMDENHYIDRVELLQNLGLGEQEISTSPPRDQPHYLYDTL